MTDVDMTAEQREKLGALTTRAASFVSEALGPFRQGVKLDVTYADIRGPNTSFDLDDNLNLTIKIPVSYYDNENTDAVVISLGHEMVHCLNPNGYPPFQATVFEEGLAEYCGHAFICSLAGRKVEYPIIMALNPDEDKYQPAYRVVEGVVIQMGEDVFFEAVRNMRADHPDTPFGRISAAQLANYLPVEEAKISVLTTRFFDWSPNEG